jgi:hypothetical protein
MYKGYPKKVKIEDDQAGFNRSPPSFDATDKE